VPAGGAGWPAARDRRHPPSTPPAASSRPRPVLDTPPRATGRCGRYPAGQEGPARHEGRPPGGYRDEGTGGAHRDGARPRRPRARRRAAWYGLARLRAARYSGWRICHRPSPCASRFSVPLQKSGFWGLFSPAPLKLVLVRQKSAVVAGGSFTSGGPSCTSRVPAVYLAGNDAGQRPDVPGRERPAAGAAGRGYARPLPPAAQGQREDGAAGAASVAVPAAPSARAARYAALGAASALVAGSPAASGAAGAASGAGAAASR